MHEAGLIRGSPLASIWREKRSRRLGTYRSNPPSWKLRPPTDHSSMPLILVVLGFVMAALIASSHFF